LAGEFNHVTDYEAETKTVTVTVPTQGSIPANSIFDWIVFMQHDVATGFNWNLTWINYKNGFGSSSTDFWMGLERLHLMTTSSPYRLRLEWQQSPTDLWFSIEYWLFYIDDEASKYILHVDHYVHGDDGRALYVYAKIFLTVAPTVAVSIMHWCGVCPSVCLSRRSSPIDSSAGTVDSANARFVSSVRQPTHLLTCMTIGYYTHGILIIGEIRNFTA